MSKYLESLTKEELWAEEELAEKTVKAIELEFLRRSLVLGRSSHTVTITARGCETTRECYCKTTYGYTHHEDDYPWVHLDGRLDRS
jgi:hypothetical protein